jgi:hypothetical protein
VSYAWISSPYRYRGTAYVFQTFSRTTGDIHDLACSPGPSKAYIVRLPILNLSGIETTLDKNATILFTTLVRLDSSIEKEIFIWVMENSKEEDKLFICRIRKTAAFALEGIEIVCRLPFEVVLISSCLMVYMPGFPAHIDSVGQRMEDKLFICRIRKTLQKYNLPSPEEILENPPKKQQWKNAMKKAINSFWYDKWTNEKQNEPCKKCSHTHCLIKQGIIMFTGNSLNFTGKFRPIVCIFPAPLYASNEAIFRPNVIRPYFIYYNM